MIRPRPAPIAARMAIAPPADRARQQEIGYIRARNQQYETHRAYQNQQR